MLNRTQSSYQNELLRRLNPADLALLEPQLEYVPLPLRMTLESAKRANRTRVFLEEGIASIVAKIPMGRDTEVESIERLARWLLMCHDRVSGDSFTITHECMSIMLGVRRPGVAVAVQELQGRGLIRANRGEIVIRDRAGLFELADGAYSEPEKEYERLTDRGAPSSRLNQRSQRYKRAAKSRHRRAERAGGVPLRSRNYSGR